MNPILDHMIEVRKGHYIHAVDVDCMSDLEDVAECFCNEFHPRYSEAQIIEFLSTLDVYYLGDDDAEEKAVYNFSFREYIEGTL